MRNDGSRLFVNGLEDEARHPSRLGGRMNLQFRTGHLLNGECADDRLPSASGALALRE